MTGTARQVKARAAKGAHRAPGKGARPPRPSSRTESATEGADSALEKLALALLSGILVAAPFLLPALHWVHYVALVPWVILVTRENARRSWLYFLAGVFVFAIMAWGPFSIFNKAVPFLIALFFVPWYLPFAVVVRRAYLRLGVPLTVLVPTAWVITEWLRIHYSAGAVPLFSLGASQFGHLKLIQVADLTGMAGVSFIVAMANGAAADVLLNRSRWEWRKLWPVGLFPVVLVAALLYGSHRTGQREFVAGPRLAIIQPNLVHYRDPLKSRGTFEKHLAFTRAEIPANSADLMVWPENAVDQVLTDDSTYVNGLQRLVREKGMQLVTGAFSWASPKPYMHTSAYHFSEDGSLLGVYDKMYLIPWSERLAFEDWLPRVSPAVQRWHRAFLKKVTRFDPVGVPGGKAVVFPIESQGTVFRFAVPICFEVTSSEFGREAVANGADFLVNITSEGVLGAPVYTHTWALSTFRAVENRAGVVRVGNNGISGFIDPNGRTQSVLRGKRTGRLFLEEGTLIDRVSVDQRRRGTFYTRHGDVFAYLCGVVSLALLVLSFRSRRLASESRAAGT